MARASSQASGGPRRGLGAQLTREWRAGPIHKLAIAAPRPRGLAAKPRDPRPADAERGARLLAGAFDLAGQTMDVGPGGDPWDRPCPSEAFAVALHGFAWMGDLLAAGEGGAQEALRLWRGWRRLFGRTGAYGWTGLALERRAFNLACAISALSPLATEREGVLLLGDLSRQARHLLGDPADPGRETERLTTVALAGAALAGPVGERLLSRALPRLERLAPRAVLPDGVHAGRAPERGLELLFDLAALDDALSHRGAPAPAEAARAIDRLTGGVRFFVLPGPRLPRFHGGGAGDSAGLQAVLALSETPAPAPGAAPYGGYQRLEGSRLALIADAGPSKQPLAVEIAVDGQPLILGCAGSFEAPADAASLRGPLGASTLGIGDASPEPSPVQVERREEDGAVWVDLSHAGWRKRFGLIHTRRLFLDPAGELRGEDLLAREVRGGRARGPASYVLRFYLAPGVEAETAGRGAVLRLPGGGAWRLQSDAPTVVIAGGTVFEAGDGQASQVLVLSGEAPSGQETRVRWKLAPDAPA